MNNSRRSFKPPQLFEAFGRPQYSIFCSRLRIHSVADSPDSCQSRAPKASWKRSSPSKRTSSSIWRRQCRRRSRSSVRALVLKCPWKMFHKRHKTPLEPNCTLCLACRGLYPELPGTGLMEDRRQYLNTYTYIDTFEQTEQDVYRHEYVHVLYVFATIYVYCIHIYTCTYQCSHTYFHTCIHTYIDTHIYICVYVYICMHVCSSYTQLVCPYIHICNRPGRCPCRRR